MARNEAHKVPIVRTEGVIPSSSLIGERIPNQVVVIDDDNAHQWLPAVSTTSTHASPTAKGLANDTSAARYITRSALAFRLRASGLSYEDIASAMVTDPALGGILPTPYGPKQVRDDVAIHLSHFRSEIADSLEDVLTLEIERFDTMLASLWPSILEGDTNAINTALRVSERRSRMLGLDQPIKVDWRIELTTLLTNGSLTLADVEAQLDAATYGQFVQYLEDRNADLVTPSPFEETVKGGAAAAKRLYEDASPGGRFSDGGDSTGSPQSLTIGSDV